MTCRRPVNPQLQPAISRAEKRLRMRQARRLSLDRLINEKYGGERGRSQAMFVYKMELRDAVCERFQSTEIL